MCTVSVFFIVFFVKQKTSYDMRISDWSSDVCSSDLKIGDHVGWNSEAGRVSGRIIKVHTRDFDYKGHTHRASADEPQYEIRSDKTDHVAAHRGAVLRKIS